MAKPGGSSQGAPAVPQLHGGPACWARRCCAEGARVLNELEEGKKTDVRMSLKAVREKNTIPSWTPEDILSEQLNNRGSSHRGSQGAAPPAPPSLGLGSPA